MVGVGGPVLLVDIIRQLSRERWHEANHVKLHAVDIGRGYELHAESDTDDAAMGITEHLINHDQLNPVNERHNYQQKSRNGEFSIRI